MGCHSRRPPSQVPWCRPDFRGQGFSYMSSWSPQVAASAVLALSIFGINDKANAAPGDVAGPFACACVQLVIGLAFSMAHGTSINPARELASRAFIWLVGYGNQVWPFAWIPADFAFAGDHLLLCRVREPRPPSGWGGGEGREGKVGQLWPRGIQVFRPPTEEPQVQGTHQPPQQKILGAVNRSIETRKRNSDKTQRDRLQPTDVTGGQSKGLWVTSERNVVRARGQEGLSEKAMLVMAKWPPNCAGAVVSLGAFWGGGGSWCLLVSQNARHVLGLPCCTGAKNVQAKDDVGPLFRVYRDMQATQCACLQWRMSESD